MKYLATIAFSLFFCLLISYKSIAQKRNDQAWHSGSIILSTNDTLKGLVKYNFKENFITYKTEDERRILLPGNFKSVSLIDTFDSTRHDLKVYKVKTAKDYTRPYFFEPVDTSGRIKLVKQFYWIEQATGITSAFFVDTRIKKQTVLYYYRKGSTVRFLKLKKREILHILKDKRHEVKLFAKENGLRFNNLSHVIKIITYYNSFTL